jgi:hypothetical protein
VTPINSPSIPRSFVKLQGYIAKFSLGSNMAIPIFLDILAKALYLPYMSKNLDYKTLYD